MNRKFIVPLIAVVSAGFMVTAVGCGGEVKVTPPPLPPPPVVEVKAPEPVVVVAPPPDRDGDGIVDAQDACPDVKGVPNADPKLNGCPPPPPPPKATGKIKLRGRRVIIPGEIEFDIGKATMKQNPKTKMLLGELVAFFQANPQVTKLEVQGHTDNVGAEDMNQKLSQARAESVAAGLVAQGVDAGRVTAKGFGSTVDFKDHGKDIPNDTPAHKAMNRRVEFHVLQLGGQDWAAPPEE